jgi:hypothetical protein
MVNYNQQYTFFRLAGEEQAGPSSSSFDIPDKDLFLLIVA